MFWMKAILIIIPCIKWNAFAELNGFSQVNFFFVGNEYVEQIEL